MGKNLVIVESPAKAKTLSRILGKDYTVEASYGHVRDLPQSADEIPKAVKEQSWARLGVNVDEGFSPVYVVPRDKKKHVKKLKDALADADELLLATDEDREGESISWHVVEVLKPKIPIRRIAFHEITDEAIHAALADPRDIDENLVRAQESRRILDRLYGYGLSPLLWKKVQTGLSAGRVQSVAVRLCVLRERERRAFVRSRYWGAEADIEVAGGRFTARMTRLEDRSIASGSDFNAATGRLLDGRDVVWLEGEEAARDLIGTWEAPWQVTRVETKPHKRRPSPPFTTSSMQQEANRKLRFSATRTMRAAQRLYEGIEVGGDRVGLITYMRTDSTTLSEKALKDAQTVIRSRYGDDFATGARRYSTKSRGAQEAHEAIRPTEFSRSPEDVAPFLSDDEKRLYELIWKRALASQMADARLLRTAVEVTAPTGGDGREATFAASGKTIEFAGFLRAYVEGSDDPAEELADQETLLPPMEEGEPGQPIEVRPTEHETQPPARFTEASLIKRLEKEGIGRPSTYASIIDTIQRRGYVDKQSNALVPTYTACAVTQLLEKHFADYVDTEFTARMEEQLDEIAGGGLDWQSHLEKFYFGGGDKAGLSGRIESEEPNIDYPAMEIGTHPDGGRPIVVRIGRYGPYLQWVRGDDDKVSASIQEDLAPADLTLERAVQLLADAERGDQSLGVDPDTGQEVYLRRGRFGPYVQLGEAADGEKPKRASLPKGVSEEEAHLENALVWLSLPRTLGEDPNTGEDVVAATGRYGPFLKRGSDTRSLPAEDDIYTVKLERALEVLAQPKTRGRRTATVLADLGKDSEGREVRVLDGRYGPYLTDGEKNASVPRGTAPESLTLPQALEILAEKGKPPKSKRKGGGRKKPAAKKRKKTSKS